MRGFLKAWMTSSVAAAALWHGGCVGSSEREAQERAEPSALATPELGAGERSGEAKGDGKEQGAPSILAVKTVKVCGRRPTANSPQSWWVDTGVYVAANTSITIDGSSPGGGIQPWAGPAWPPAGNPASTGWTDSVGYRFGLTNPADNVSFSLLAKIGRDGVARKVGTQLTFTAPVSGTLYLAFNDGVSFEDNAGSWNVNVTYPQTVSFGPGYGTELIYADRINTSLVDSFGVVLTVRDGNPSLAWNATYVANVEAALSAIQARLGAPIKFVFGGVELRLSGIAGAGSTTRGSNTTSVIRFGTDTRGSLLRQGNRSWGQISAPAGLDYYPSAIPYGFNNAGDRGIQNTVIHELGHLLEYRTMNATSPYTPMINAATALGLRPMKNGAADGPSDVGVFWEAQVDVSTQPEIIADAFLNWVRNSYVGMVGQIDVPPGGLSVEQQRIATFWNGGTFNGQVSPGWGAANGFRAAATAFVSANNMSAFLRALGNGNPAARSGGDPDPTCAF